MVRSRRNSLVQNIASQPNVLETQKVPEFLDDIYLFEKLQKLSLSIDLSGEDSSSSAEVVGSESLDSNSDKYNSYIEYQGRLQGSLDEYIQILDQTKKINDQLTLAIDKFHEISVDTGHFIDDTNLLYNSRKELSTLANAIPAYLRYFENLDPIMRRLNHANSPNIVCKDSFRTLLTNIDSSLIFLDSHPDLVDAETYRIKFKQCLIRACDLISNYLGNLLRQMHNEIQEKDIMANENTREALVYNKFATIAENFQSQVIELVRRVLNPRYSRYHDELNSILHDCFIKYFEVRTKILNPIIWLQLDTTIIKDKTFNLVKFVQDNKTLFQQLCSNEYDLFMKFFSEQEICKDKVNHWFIRLCDPLYITVGTTCMRETHINALCDSLILFAPFYEFEENSEEYNKHFNQVKFDKVFNPVVERLQNRLIDRVKTYIDQNITRYTPTADDCMISNRKLKVSNEEEFVKIYVENYQNNPIDEFTEANDQNDGNLISSYYVPLIKGLALLFKIFEMVIPVVFDHLAHQVVHSCIISLKKAYELVALKENSNTSVTTDLDLKLFYLRNLLLLRDEIQNFNIKYTLNTKSLEFSNMPTALKSYKLGTMSLFSLAKELVPKVVNNMVDARIELVQELRNIINDFTHTASKDILDDYLNLIEDKDVSLVEQNEKMRQNVETKIPRLYTQICNSITDKEIANHLIDAIQEYCTDEYAIYYNNITELVENDEGHNIVKSEIGELMYVDVFTKFFTKCIDDIRDLKN